MDLKYIQDEADLSVGLSVTCSTTSDDCYSPAGPLIPQHMCPSTSSLFLMHYTPENIPLPSAESVVQSPDIGFSQSFLANEHINGTNQDSRFQEDVKDVINLDSFELNTRKQKSSLGKILPGAHKMQVCKTCGKTFKFQTSLLRHNNKVHFSRYQCSICFRVFSRQSYLDVHTSKPGTSCYVEHKIKSKKRRGR